MKALAQPLRSALYDYERLAQAMSIWAARRNFDGGFAAAGFAPESAIARLTVSSRQWDDAGDVLDAEQEAGAAEIMDAALLELEPFERALVMFGQCDVASSWVRDADPARGQVRYEMALVKLAGIARKAGLGV